MADRGRPQPPMFIDIGKAHLQARLDDRHAEPIADRVHREELLGRGELVLVRVPVAVLVDPGFHHRAYRLPQRVVSCSSSLPTCVAITVTANAPSAKQPTSIVAMPMDSEMKRYSSPRPATIGRPITKIGNSKRHIRRPLHVLRRTVPYRTEVLSIRIVLHP